MNTLTFSDPDIVAQVALLKAAYNQKTALVNQISRLKIKNNYEKSNKDFRDLKDLIPLSKQMQKRLNDITHLNSIIRRIPRKYSDESNLFHVFSQFSTFLPHLEINRQVFSLNFSEEAYLEDLKSRHDSLQQELEEKSLVFSENESNLARFSLLEEELPVLESEVNDLYAIQSEVSEALHLKEKNKAKSRILHKKSLEQVKIFQKLSENGILLRSKLLLREELLKNLKSAEKELENLENKTKNESERMKNLELEKKEEKKELHRLQLDFFEVKKDIVRLEMRLEGLNAEKDAILESIYEKKSCPGDSSRSEYVEEETVQIASWLSGFSEILKEKKSLMQENAKLKEKISKLFQPNR
jgi:DNA repair exonuclease SbcCD ATPase subunit